MSDASWTIAKNVIPIVPVVIKPRFIGDGVKLPSEYGNCIVKRFVRDFMWRSKRKKHLLVEVKFSRAYRGISEHFSFSQMWHQRFEVFEYEPIAVVTLS
jgi:hypothetical protein